MRKNSSPSPNSAEPIHIRLDLLLQDHSGNLKRREDGAALTARPVKSGTPSELLSESALDRDRLVGLLKNAAPTAVGNGSDAAPDIEVTLVLYV